MLLLLLFIIILKSNSERKKKNKTQIFLSYGLCLFEELKRRKSIYPISENLLLPKSTKAWLGLMLMAFLQVR